MKKWIIKNKKADLDRISEKYNIEKLLARILVNRELDEEDIGKFLSSDIESLYEPSLMKDMDSAADAIINSIYRGEKIRIVGDYDQDGVSSTVILIKGFTDLAKKLGKDINADYKIPDRVIDGYGINENIVSEAYYDGINLIITCDNGISAFEAAEKASELGLKMIITDHHDVPIYTYEDGTECEKIPEAVAVVNPKRSDCEYPFDLICGATVALKLIQNIYNRLKLDKRDIEELYQFAGMATVCDVVDLVDENRIIVKKGLELVNKTENIGLKMLIERAGLKDKEIGAYHLGYILGPCINASGRLESANIAVELFLTEDRQFAEEKAEILVSLNEERKELTEEGLNQTINMVKNNDYNNDDVIIVYNPNIHESIAGIIAGRIKERYYKPSIILTKSKYPGIAKGSGRSIEKYDMFCELSKVKELFEKFGGHPMAAGLSLKEDNIDVFRKEINRNSELTEDDFIEKIYIDAHLPVEGINIALPERLSILEPFGKANRKPSFGDREIDVERIMILGKNYKIIKMVLKKNGINMPDAVYFGEIDEFLNYLYNKFGEEQVGRAMEGITNDINLDLIFYPSINEYRGNRSLQLVIIDYR